MSELTNASGGTADLRGALLSTACSAALLAIFYAGTPAMAGDGNADNPIVWVEVGGAFTQLNNSQEIYLPPFAQGTDRKVFITQSPLYPEKNAPISWDGNAKVSFEPEGTDWAFSAAIRYGRNTTDRVQDQRTRYKTPTQGDLAYNAYQHVTAKTSESHMVLDFSAGKDVGLGKFGSAASSVFSLGVRYAQFNSRSNVDVSYQPTNQYRHYRLFHASLTAARKFTGIGPSLSWDASAGLIGNPQAGSVALDWGLNGAVLFGRQQVNGHHHSSNAFHSNPITIYPGTPTSAVQHRNKETIVPNVGGFAELSLRYPNAKLSIGYSADLFFGAIDGGIDARKIYNRGFYGPFASISIGVGG